MGAYGFPCHDRAKALGSVKRPHVLHKPRGNRPSGNAVKSLWRRTRERAGVKQDAWFRDLRPKALSDAKRRGVRLDDLRDAAGHTSVTTTEGYAGSRRRKRSSDSICRSRRKLSSATRSRRRRAFSVIGIALRKFFPKCPILLKIPLSRVPTMT
jgi:hypothetical protein